MRASPARSHETESGAGAGGCGSIHDLASECLSAGVSLTGVYLIDAGGCPRRIGLTVGNELSDHVLERKNHLYLAASKLRTCAIGPELVIDGSFDLVAAEVSVKRGEDSLSNIEHHHFKFESHRRPGDLHIHFFGADAFSFGDGVQIQDGDVMQIRFEGFGRRLRNPLSRVPPSTKAVVVQAI